MNPSAQPAPAQPPTLTEALDRLWTRFQPEIEQRVALLESAAAALAAHTLTEAEQKAAHSAAHKLAGVLGTFGLAEGTAQARELEQLYSRGGPPDPSLGQRLAAIATELRTVVESRE